MSRFRFATLRRFFLVTFVLALASCADPEPTVKTVEGTYVGVYGGGEDVIDLKEDGSFTQTFSIGGKRQFENSGRWSVDGGDIKLEDFMVVFDAETKRLQHPPKKYSIIRCMWTREPDQLVFDIDAGYVASKRKR